MIFNHKNIRVCGSSPPLHFGKAKYSFLGGEMLAKSFSYCNYKNVFERHFPNTKQNKKGF